MSAEVCTVEFQAVAQGGDTLAYCDSLEEAKGVPGCRRIERVTRYHDDRVTVWAATPEGHETCLVCGDPHPAGALEEGLCPSCCDLAADD